jgi:hypothetical protein
LAQTKIIKISVKRFILVIMLSCIMVSSTVGYLAYAASSNYYQVITGGQYPGAPSFSIYEQDGVYYAKNAWGGISFASTNSSETVMSVAGSNRSIVLKGDLTFSNNLLFSGYRDLHIFGSASITFVGNVGFQFINCRDSTLKEITINGGDVAVYVDPQCINVKVDGVKFYNAIRQASNVGGRGCGTQNCFVSGGCSEFAIIVNSGYQNFAYNNYIENITNGGYAIELGYNSKGNQIIGNKIYNCGGANGGGIICLSKYSGFHTELTATSNAIIDKNTIIGTKRGIWLAAHLANSFTISNITISNNQIEVQASSYGITTSVTSADHVGNISCINIWGNIIRKASNATSTTGIDVVGTSNYVHDNDVTGIDTPIRILSAAWQPSYTVKNNVGLGTSEIEAYAYSSHADFLEHGSWIDLSSHGFGTNFGGRLITDVLISAQCYPEKTYCWLMEKDSEAGQIRIGVCDINGTTTTVDRVFYTAMFNPYPPL